MALIEYRIGEVAERLGLSIPTVRNYCLSGKLKFSMTPGGHMRISQDALADFLRSDINRQGPLDNRTIRGLSGPARRQTLTPRVLPLATAATYIGVSPNTMRSICHDGKIPCFITPGGHYRITIKSLDEYLEQRQSAAKAYIEGKAEERQHRVADDPAEYGGEGMKP
jgi:excisionase family DNA binding protein